MGVREILNRVKIEGWRLSRVPIDPTGTIYQGDMLVWNASTYVAETAASGASLNFVGVSDTTNPVETAGSTRFLSNTQNPRVNVIQQGLVGLLCGEATTYYPFDAVTVADIQHVKKTGVGANNTIGFVDPGVGAAGKAYVLGDEIPIWLTVKADYRAFT